MLATASVTAAPVPTLSHWSHIPTSGCWLPPQLAVLLLFLTSSCHASRPWVCRLQFSTGGLNWLDWEWGPLGTVVQPSLRPKWIWCTNGSNPVPQGSVGANRTALGAILKSWEWDFVQHCLNDKSTAPKKSHGDSVRAKLQFHCHLHTALLNLDKLRTRGAKLRWDVPCLGMRNRKPTQITHPSPQPPAPQGAPGARRAPTGDGAIHWPSQYRSVERSGHGLGYCHHSSSSAEMCFFWG